MKKSYIIIIGLILISFIIGIYLYPQMPDKMASHWNAQDQVDDYMSKFWALFLMPIVTVAMFLLFIFIPKIDPLKKNIEKFRNYYNNLMVLIIIYMFYIYLLTIFYNLGFRFSMTQALIPAFGILFFYIGSIMKKLKRNWFIGIRTPWTLSNDNVWKKTHLLGGKLFMACGLLAFAGIFFPNYLIWIMVVPIIVVSLFAAVYSYFEFQKVKK